MIRPQNDGLYSPFHAEKHARCAAQLEQALAAAIAERDGIAQTLRAALRQSDEELQRARATAQALWGSRRVLVDEITALRARVATLEEQEQTARNRLHEGEQRAQKAPPPPPPPPPSPPPSSIAALSPGQRHGARRPLQIMSPPSSLSTPQRAPLSTELEVLLDSELALTDARLQILLSNHKK